MNRRPVHGEANGTGNFDVHLDDGEVVEIDAVVPGGVVMLETGTLPAEDPEHGLFGDGAYVTLDLRQLEDVIAALTQARDFMREQRA